MTAQTSLLCLALGVLLVPATAVADEALDRQIASLNIVLSKADSNGDGALSGEELTQIAVLLEQDPILRSGLSGPVRRAEARTFADVMQFDVNGDGQVQLADVAPRSLETLQAWDFNADGKLGYDELSQLNGLIQFQAFNGGIGGNTQGMGPALDVIESLNLDNQTFDAVLSAFEAEAERISAFQVEVHQIFLQSVENMLGEHHPEFLEAFAENLISRPATFNPLGVQATLKRIEDRIKSYDTNGDGQVAGSELNEALGFFANVRVENAPDEYLYWQRNQKWLDHNSDRQLLPEDIPFLADEIFSRFDLDNNALIDPQEYDAMRDDRLAQYLRREIGLYRYGYPTMVPVLESMGILEDHQDDWDQLMVAHERRFSSARQTSRNTLVESLERILGPEGYQEFREGFGIN